MQIFTQVSLLWISQRLPPTTSSWTSILFPFCTRPILTSPPWIPLTNWKQAFVHSPQSWLHGKCLRTRVWTTASWSELLLCPLCNCYLRMPNSLEWLSESIPIASSVGSRSYPRWSALVIPHAGCHRYVSATANWSLRSLSRRRIQGHKTAIRKGR